MDIYLRTVYRGVHLDGHLPVGKVSGNDTKKGQKEYYPSVIKQKLIHRFRPLTARCPTEE